MRIFGLPIVLTLVLIPCEKVLSFGTTSNLAVRLSLTPPTQLPTTTTTTRRHSVAPADATTTDVAWSTESQQVQQPLDDDDDEQSSSSSSSSEPETKKRLVWEVYVDQSKVSLERGSSATLDSFVSLAPPEQVKVVPAVFGSATKAKSPMVRCFNQADPNDCLEITNVDSVDKVYRILTLHMNLGSSVPLEGCECLKWTYKGNSHLEEGEVTLAIDAYGKALATNFTQMQQTHGQVLLMRAAAFLERAASHRVELRAIVQDMSKSIPSRANLVARYHQAARYPSMSVGIFERVLADARQQESKFLQTKFRHGLYQYALLHAARDALQATQLLPTNTQSWLQAGEILSELWIVGESLRYYEKAMQVDPSLTESITTIVEGLRQRKEVYEKARGYGWPEDIVRLALDVAG